MNSCVLMAEIVNAPELRYTQDGTTAIAEMTVQFPALRAEEPLQTLKVTGWGNLAQQIQERFHQGDQVIIEGRLTMRTIDRPEGFKEKRAELRASRIHTLDMMADAHVAAPTGVRPAAPQPQVPPPPQPVVPTPPATQPQAPLSSPPPMPSPAVASPVEPPEPPNYDDIPF